MSALSSIAETPASQGDWTVPAETLRVADLDQLARFLRGSYLYPFLLAVVAFTTPYQTDNPGCFLTFATVIAAALALRFVFWLRSERIYDANPAVFRRLLVASLSLSSTVAGLFYFSTLLFYGFEGWAFTTAFMWFTALAAGSTITFTPNFRLLQLQLLLLLGPVVVLGMLMGGTRGYSYTIGMMCLCIFLLMQGRSLHRSYWKNLKDNALEKARSRELEVAKIAAEAASVAKGKFLANMSHEIRTPMHGILGMAQLALSAATQRESLGYVKTLRASAEGLLHVLNDILDFSKIEAGKLALEQTSFSLRQIIEDTSMIVTPQADAKALAFSCRIDDNIPDFLLGDPGRLRQVLVNLVGNAVKFTASGSVSLEVSREALDVSGAQVHLRFRVSDTGIGISQDQQRLIFEAFAQADADISRRFGGSGLGLAICSQLVQLMGGAIHVESRPGLGSVFQFGCLFGVAEAVTVTQRALVTKTLEPMAILLAEDNPVNQTIALRMLAKRGHRVTVAATGVEAIKAWELQDFDVILMDNQMPEMGGVEAVSHIRSLETESGRRRTTIIALTASAMTGDRQRFLAAGMDGYLAKPFSAENLDEALSHISTSTPSPI